MADTADQLFAHALDRHRAGLADDAVAAYRHVIIVRPAAAAVYVNLTNALQSSGDLDAACCAGSRATLLAPGLSDAHAVAGDAARAAGRDAHARRCYRTALAVAPGQARGLNNFANLLAALGADEPAAVMLRRAIAVAPDQAAPHANLSAVELKLERISESIASARRSLALDPAVAETLNNLGNALIEADRPTVAAQQFRRALTVFPHFTDASVNLSGSLIDAGQSEAGRLFARRAIASAPERADAYNNFANALMIAGHLSAADAAFRRSLRVDPTEARTHYNHAAVLLKQGRFDEGWSAYEWRLRTRDARNGRLAMDAASWDGQDLDGRTIVLWAEQGQGDVLQFCRYAPLVAARGGRVVLQVYPSLVRLLGTVDGVDRVVADNQPLPPCDVQISLMSLPHRLGTRVDTVPARIPYVHADPLATVLWRHRLAGLPGIKIGLVWAGDPRPGQRGAHLLDQRRSLTLSSFAGLAMVPGISLVSLQKGSPAAQLRQPPPGLSLFDAGPDLTDFADTAALIANLDLVISADTAVAHLAGALGADVWILSRFDGCWRWLDGRDDSPWYPTARLFRQTAAGAWGPVLDRLCDTLRGRLRQGKQ